MRWLVDPLPSDANDPLNLVLPLTEPKSITVGTNPAHVFHVTGQSVPCSRCHNGYKSTSVNPATHVDGTRDVIVVPTTGGTLRINGWDCGACHGALGV